MESTALMPSESTTATSSQPLPAIPYTPWLDVSLLPPQQAVARNSSDTNSAQKYLGYNAADIVRHGTNGDTAVCSTSFNVPDTIINPSTGQAEPAIAIASAELTVEDWGCVKLIKSGGEEKKLIDLSEDVARPDSLGGHMTWSGAGASRCDPGSYILRAEGRNIDMEDPNGNQFIFKCDLRAKLIESGGRKDICKDPCTCGPDSEEGGVAGEATAGTCAAMGRSSSTHSGGSSAATGVVAQVKENKMAWQCRMGTLRGLGSAFGGRLQLSAEEFSPELAQPESLVYSHRAEAWLEVPAGGIVPGERFNIRNGAREIALRYYINSEPEGSFVVSPEIPAQLDNNGSEEESSTHNTLSANILPIGVDTQGGGCARLNADGSVLTWLNNDGSGWEFSTTTGECLACIGTDHVRVNDVSALLQVRRTESGTLQQVWSHWDGLAQVENTTDSGYELAFYTADAVSGQDAEGSYLLTEGATAFKRFAFALVPAAAEGEQPALRITEQGPGLPDKVVSWTQGADKAWSMTQGSGEDALTELRTRTVLTSGSYGSTSLDVWQLTTEYRKGNTTTSTTAEVYQSTPMGELLLAYVEGYGSDSARTTLYSYDGVGNRIAVTTPEGAVHRTVYDQWGRPVREITPWGAGDYTRIVDTTYAYTGGSTGATDTTEGYFSSEPAEVIETIQPNAPNGVATYVRMDYYEYSTQNKLRRVERQSMACGDTSTRISITETHTADADNIHARGRLHMTQAENGVQTWYEYAPTTEYGALYTETRETRVNGEPVRSHSTRSIRYISAAGNTLRAEEWVLLYNGEWAKTSGETYSYDVQNRRIGCTKDNGRSSSRTLTCMGQPLREVDEDGILTDYSYDSARQLVEITRAEVRDGDTTITPETITEYTRDARGRILCTRIHTGSKVTAHSRSYDAAGRLSSETDTYGATTSYAYSADGLTTTATQEDGTTRIRTRYVSGQLAAESGTAQPERVYRYSIENNCLCTRTLLGEEGPVIREEHSNGFGDIVLSKRAVPGGFVCTRSSYNANGQLSQQQQDTGLAEDGKSLNAMAPILYSYHSFGELAREVVDLRTEEQADEAPGSVSNSRLTIYTHSKLREADGGIYSMVTTTRNNAQGGAYTNSTATLISALDATLESKSIHTDPRGKVSTTWVERGAGTLRTQKQQQPSSAITASSRVVDGFITAQTDSAGVTTSQSRSYGTDGMTLTQTDARGHSSTTYYDLQGRPTATQNATGACTSATYSLLNGQLLSTVDELNNSTHYRYDLQGNKIAEWGTNTQPVTFGYDAEGRLTSLTTFRVGEGDIETDPGERTDGDSTHWNYDPASGLELSKTYADGSSITKTYDAFGRLATETNARGVTKTYCYLSTTGELTGIVYSDAVTPAQVFTYTLTGKLASVTDAAGTRAFTYNEYDELVSDCLIADEKEHLITENWDDIGRSSGFVYSKDGVSVSAEQYGYGVDGRLSSAAFCHGGEWKSFGYNYLPGTHLLQTLSMPNGLTLTQQYESQRDQLASMEYTRGESSVVERYYTYDALCRPLTRQQNRQGGTRSDSFTHNNRSELTAGTLGTAAYSYAYDNIGNRKTAQEDAESTTAYTANALNQYTAVGSFRPAYDADGNQTRVQTSTGIWDVSYNAENRPTQFTRSNADGTTTRITCAYDFMGRRATKKVETITADASATTNLHQRYLYRGYLQIACCDLSRTEHPHLWFITWDLAQPVTTRPLALRKDGTWYTYGWDLTKNICEVFGVDGLIKTTYSYTPYGAVTAEGSATQFIQWSSEFYDEELGLVYYNYRLYNPRYGRWIGRDLTGENGGNNSYSFVNDNSLYNIDIL